MRRITVGVLLAATALTGCGGNGEPNASPTTTPPPTTASSTPSASPTATSTCPAQPALPAGATLVTATVTGTTVTTAHQTWSVKLGTTVRIAITADRADEVHVHSYDKKQDTTKGCPTAIDFTANVPGTVEVELEHAGLHLFDLKAS